MRLIHLLLIFSLVWILYCMYVYILPVYLFEKIFCYSYRRKIIDIQHFPYTVYFQWSLPVFRRRPNNEVYSFAINFLFSVDFILYVCLYIIFI